MKKKITIIFILVLIILFIVGSDSLTSADQNSTRPLNKHNFDLIETIEVESNFVTYTDFRPNIENIASIVVPTDSFTYVSGLFKTALECNISGEECKTIRFDSALELYNFSVDVSFNRNKIEDTRYSDNIVQALLSLNYALGMDIDYSSMKSQQFMPIGYNFVTSSLGHREAVFTGVFDGRGFEISNLYLAGYDYLVVTEGTGEAAEDIPLSTFYSMFTENKGTIKNLGLINPTLEIRTVHDNILRASNLVGLNHGNGIINKVYVIDSRANVSEAGIRMKTPVGASDNVYQAAGIVFSNAGTATFSEAYFAGKIVVNSSYINSFDVQPVLFENTGNLGTLVYDDTLYLETVVIESSAYDVTVPNSYAVGEESSVLKTSSSLGNVGWYYFPDYKHPAILGLDKDTDNKYIIENAVDFIAFSKIINLYSPNENHKKYYNFDYKIINNIDLNQVAKGAYKIPETVFGGSLTGIYADNKNYYISNLQLINGINLETEYFAGLFSVMSGSVSNITLDNFKITLEDAQNYYSSKFYIGSIAGVSRGEIKNVSVKLEIDLGNSSIGEYAVGGIVGEASGTVESVYTVGNINNKIRTFNSTYEIDSKYYIGGIIGKTGLTKLTLYNALNTADIHGLGTTNQVNNGTDTVYIYTGGVIGYVHNTSTARNNLGFITNESEINIKNYSSSNTVNQYVAGVVGYSSGLNYDFDINTGEWTNTNEKIINVNNEANIKINVTSNNVISAGVVVSDHTEMVEFLYLYNHTTFSTNTYTDFKYTSLVYDIGTGGVTLSQSTNYGNYIIDGNYNFSGVFLSQNNSPSLLRFVDNRGDITYSNQTFTSERSIAGVSLSKNIDYLNVYFSGNIIVHSTTSKYPLWVAGITNELSADRYMINSMTRGRDYIKVPDKNNPTILIDELVPSKLIVANHDTASNNTAHVFIGGLVNTNLSGNLQNYDTADSGTATIGIINSANYADITTKFSDTVKSIFGNGNTYAGGITTFNAGSIQDTLNFGDVKVSNLTNVSGSPKITLDSGGRGGLVSNYKGSVIIGGVASSATIGYSRIFDSSNSGDIIAISTSLARAGGVLGLSLLEELEAGSLPLLIIWNGYGDDTLIEKSILSNCINYGTVSAITETIIDYSTSTTIDNGNWDLYFYIGTGASDYYTVVKSYPTTVGTYQRIGVYASAGGVIGYGLCIMRRMLNHGNVSSTDVAGGIVGATFAGLGGSGTYTYVNINVALNYGNVNAIKNQNFSQIEQIADLTYNNLIPHFYDPNDNFIKPTNLSDEQLRTLPGGKRGIGGIFGRLQRTDSTYMSSENGAFSNIVNMDPNVDLIGRLDQVIRFTNSNRYFIFRNAVNFYSANPNDTTQAAFTGYSYFYATSNSNPITVATRTTTNYKVYTSEKYTYSEVGGVITETHYKYEESWTEKTVTGMLHVANGGRRVSAGTSTILEERTINSTIGWVKISEQIVGQMQEDRENPIIPEKTQIGSATTGNIETEFRYTSSNPDRHTALLRATRVPYISEKKSDLYMDLWDQQYVYDEDFAMRNADEFSKYIYFVENEILSTRFEDTRKNGMYVLSTSTGSSVGSSLPSNVDLTKLQPIAGLLVYNGDYINPPRGSLEKDIVNNYISLLQTKFNDKSEIIKNTNYNLKLVEVDVNGKVGGNKTILVNPTIDRVNKTITFTLSLQQIVGPGPLYYKLIDGDLPVNAKIGTKYTSGVNPEIDPILNISNLAAGTHLLGSVTSYSQAAREVTIFREPEYNYTTDYTIYLNKLSATGVPSPSDYRVTESGSWSSKTNYNTIPDTVINDIGIRFLDANSALPIGADIYDYISLWYGDEVVSKEYYQLTTEKVYLDITDRRFSFQIKLVNSFGRDLLRRGTYTIKFKYYSSDNEGIDRSISFTKGASILNDIVSLSHYSSGNLVPSGASISSVLNFGYPMITNPSFGSTTDDSIPSYLSNTQYSISSLTSLVISPFASISKVSLTKKTYNTTTGLITYVYTYTVVSESGAEKPYTHTITEKSISIVNYYKNNNKVTEAGLFASREAISTRFSFDFGIDQLYSNLIYNYYKPEEEPLTNTYFEVNGLIPGIEIDTENYLSLVMSQEVGTGTYDYIITLVRVEGTQEYRIVFATITIEKKPGINAHLIDIKFSETVQDTSYPLIYVALSDGGINYESIYRPRMYFAGIDYNESNLDANVQHYRINGEVANTPLNEYMPYFLDYLPPGAKISRKEYTSVSEYYWTTPVNKNSNPQLINSLLTDFTVYPDTKLEYGAEDRGNDGIADDDILITYKVISESGKEIYYHISVIDIIYNVSMVFTVNYDDNANELVGNPLLINVKNIVTNIPWGETVINDPTLFPQYTSITKINNSVNIYYLDNNSGYKFRFGRNMSGYYNFNVILPSAGEGYLYTYKIEYQTATATYELDDTNNRVSGVNGKYYYINYGEKNRTRNFTITISKVVGVDSSWGLNDQYYSWNK